MNIAIDIDGTITDNARFFARISSHFCARNVYIFTGRDYREAEETEIELQKCGISYNKLLHAKNWQDKGRLCQAYDIDILFEDQDEYIEHVPITTMVFKVRNEGNFNFRSGQWLTKADFVGK